MGRKSSRLSENSPAQLSPGSASSLLRKTRRKNEVSSLANYSHQHGAPSSAGDEETTSVAQVSAENRTTKKKGDRLRGRGRNNETMLHFAIGMSVHSKTKLAQFVLLSFHFINLSQNYQIETTGSFPLCCRIGSRSCLLSLHFETFPNPDQLFHADQPGEGAVPSH